MRSRNRQILNLIVVTAVSIGLLAGMNAVGDMQENKRLQTEQTAEFQKLISAAAYREVKLDDKTIGSSPVLMAHEALSAKDVSLGYIVLVKTPGYASDLSVRVAVDAAGKNVLGLRVISQNEPVSTGGQVALPFFYGQFAGRSVPLYLLGEEPKVQPAPRTIRDGTYSAEEATVDAATGYRYTLTLTIAAGRIKNVVWDATRAKTSKNLRQASSDGEVKPAAGVLPWHEQAIALEALLLKLQDPAFIKLREDGTPVDASVVTLSAQPFVALAENCIARAAVPSLLAGTLKDGAFHAQQAAFDAKTGYRDYVDITVESGKIASVIWDAEKQGGGDTRSQASKKAKASGGSQPWHVQAAAMTAYLLARQDPTVIGLDANGLTHDVPGVDIQVNIFLDLVRTCMLQSGMMPAPTPTPAPVKSSGQIDTVSGATLTSRSVVKAANVAANYIQEMLAAKTKTGS